MNRKFALTPAGEFFYKKSLIIVSDYDRLVRDSSRIAQNDHAELRIGYLKSYAGGAVRSAVALFSEKYPDVRASIMSGSHEELYEALRNENVDIIMSDQRRGFSDDGELLRRSRREKSHFRAGKGHSRRSEKYALYTDRFAKAAENRAAIL